MDDKAIHEAVSSLDVVRRAVFAATCAERVIGDVVECGGDDDVARRAMRHLESVWANCSLAPRRNDELERARDEWMQRVCTEGGALEGSSELMVLIAAIDAVTAGVPDAAARAAGGATNVALERALRRGLPADRPASISRSSIRRDGGLEDEWSRQRRDIDDLAGGTDVAAIARVLRERARSERSPGE